MAAEDPVLKKCLSKYSDEDLVKVEQLATATAAMKCFLDDFHAACSDYVKSQIMDFAASLAATASG